MMNTNVGRWRPVQGMFNAYAIYSGLRGIIAGPVPGQALAVLLGEEPSIIAYIFYASLVVGGLAAMWGETLQLKATKNQLTIDAAKMIDGLYIEAGGDILIALNYMALMFSVFTSPTTVWERAIVYLVIGFGFACRFCQAILDTSRLKRAMREAGLNV